jgi:hypothetical protein
MSNTNPICSDEIASAKTSVEAASNLSSPPYSNTGGASRPNKPNTLKINPNTGDVTLENGTRNEASVPQTTPGAGKKRASRAKMTSLEMEAFLDLWFFDYMSVTIPNLVDGKGQRVVGEKGDAEVAAAEATLFAWVVKSGLHEQRIGRGADGFPGACHLGSDPNGERQATIRIGHKTVMPNLDIPGGDGACAVLAVSALTELGPVLVARADVSWDHSKAGLFDQLLDYARQTSTCKSMKAPRLIESDTGRTFYWGKGETTVKVYQKDLERVARGKLGIAEADHDLVRIEFTFRPKKGRKAGYAFLARDQGPGALLGSVHWVRKMIAFLAEVTDHAQDTTLTVTRILCTPDPRTIRAKAEHGLQQYAKTFCRAAAARIVHDEFGGDYRAATISPELLFDAALDFVSGALADAAHDVIAAQGLDAAREIEEEAARLRVRLNDWIKRQTAEADDARSKLLEYVEDMTDLRGAPPATEKEAA